MVKLHFLFFLHLLFSVSKVTSVFGFSFLFESFNFRYFGPVDGHDVIGLAKVMEDF